MKNIRAEFIKAFQDFAIDDEGRAKRATQAQQLIEANDVSFVMFKKACVACDEARPTVYISNTKDGVELAAYPADHPDENQLESYTFYLMETIMLRRPVSDRAHHISVNVLRNILERAGVKVVIE